jgi:hypothetical protein
VGRNARLLIGAAGLCAATVANAAEAWLPYPAGTQAVCLQGPFGNHTHKGGYAWDFGLPEGTPVVAAAPGRVIWVIDESVRTGYNSFDASNHVFVDLGGGRFATYTHHVTRSAQVRPGDLVAAGTVLAKVGKIGTFEPHIHFDVRGPSWHQTHDVAFRTAIAVEPVAGGLRYASATRPGTPPSAFQDSVIAGDEFAANGVRLDPGRPAFHLASGAPFFIEGRILEPAGKVSFYLWYLGKSTEYSAHAVPDAQGRFRLRVNIPRTSLGPRWYRITIEDQRGNLRDVATLPALVE